MFITYIAKTTHKTLIINNLPQPLPKYYFHRRPTFIHK